MSGDAATAPDWGNKTTLPESSPSSVTVLHACPVCGGDLKMPWDLEKEPWRCKACGARIDISGIGRDQVLETYR